MKQVKELKNTAHRIIWIKPVEVKLKIYIDSHSEFNMKSPKFEVGHHVLISKY